MKVCKLSLKIIELFLEYKNQNRKQVVQSCQKKTRVQKFNTIFKIF